jgi:NAD(P)-dependent dehydrogenase (short-subunit alcohol dehydrogenase family)
MSLKGKVAIVTGAARGLGRAYVLRLAALGADVVVVDLDLKGAAKYDEVLSASSVSEEVRAAGRKSIEIETDLAQRSAANDVAKQAMAAFGRIDILVNNAGGAITPAERSKPSVVPDEDIELSFDANFLSMIYCCQAVVPVMRSQKSGVIVNTASTAARMIGRGGTYSIYGAAKAAVTHYTRSLAAEVGPDGIRANCIAPGVMLTARIKAQARARGIGNASEADHIPLRRLGEPEDCAGVIEFLTTDLSRYVTGQCISVCGGAALTPA